jgi:hypothetical protein
MVFLLEITNIWLKSRDFWFADFLLKIFKIHRLVWIFGCFECVSSNKSNKVITNPKFYKHCFIKDNLHKHCCITG